MVLIRYNRRSSIPIGAPVSTSALFNPLRPSQSGLVLRYFFQRSILPFVSALLSRMGTPQSPMRSAWISFQTLYLPPHLALLSMDGQLRWIGSPQSQSALLGLDLRPSISFCITISTPLDHLTRCQALLHSWWRTSFSPEFIILPFKLHFDSPQG